LVIGLARVCLASVQWRTSDMSNLHGQTTSCMTIGRSSAWLVFSYKLGQLAVTGAWGHGRRIPALMPVGGASNCQSLCTPSSARCMRHCRI